MQTEHENSELRRIAQEYAARYGRELLEENAWLERGPVRYAAPKLDKTMREILGRQKRANWVRGMSVAAACLLAVVLLPLIARVALRSEAPAPAPDMSAEVEVPFEPAPLEPAPAEPELDLKPTATQESAGGVVADRGLIPLAFTLPDNLSVTGAELDNGLSVYYLADEYRDDVVMTIVEQPGIVPEGAVQLNVSGETVYAVSTANYQLLAFETGGLAYALTCEYDINTLLRLSESIL